METNGFKRLRRRIKSNTQKKRITNTSTDDEFVIDSDPKKRGKK